MWSRSPLFIARLVQFALKHLTPQVATFTQEIWGETSCPKTTHGRIKSRMLCKRHQGDIAPYHHRGSDSLAVHALAHTPLTKRARKKRPPPKIQGSTRLHEVNTKQTSLVTHSSAFWGGGGGDPSVLLRLLPQVHHTHCLFCGKQRMIHSPKRQVLQKAQQAVWGEG